MISLIDKQGQALLEQVNDIIITRKSQGVTVPDSDFNISSLEDENLINVVKVYHLLFKSVPFPLNSLDNDLLYKVIGKVIATKLKKLNITLNDIYVNNGLNVTLDSVTLNLRNNSWTVIDEVSVGLRQGLNLDVHSTEVSYPYFEWLLKAYETTSVNELEDKFYREFFSSIYRSVGYSLSDMYDTILNVVLFNRTRIISLSHLTDRDILDLNDNTLYEMNIVKDGYRKVKGEVMLVYINNELRKLAKQVPVFHYTLTDEYGSTITNDKTYSNLFKLINLRRENDNEDCQCEEFGYFKSIKLNDKLIYKIEEKLYLENLTKNSIKLLGEKLDILGYQISECGCMVYLVHNLGLVGNTVKQKVYELNVLSRFPELMYKGLIYLQPNREV